MLHDTKKIDLSFLFYKTGPTRQANYLVDEPVKPNNNKEFLNSNIKNNNSNLVAMINGQLQGVQNSAVAHHQNHYLQQVVHQSNNHQSLFKDHLNQNGRLVPLHHTMRAFNRN